MATTKSATKKSEEQQLPTASCILQAAPPPPKADEDQAGRRIVTMPAGKYRVIHGSVFVPRPVALRTRPDGSIDENEPKNDLARPGSVLFLTAEDATQLFHHSVIEELDAKPSRLGKVWEPPKPARAQRGMNVGAVG